MSFLLRSGTEVKRKADFLTTLTVGIYTLLRVNALLRPPVRAPR